MKKIMFMMIFMAVFMGCNKTECYDYEISEDVTETEFFCMDEIKYYFMVHNITDSKYDSLKNCENAALYKDYIYCVKNAALYRYNKDMSDEKLICDLKDYSINFIYDNKAFIFKTGIFDNVTCFTVDLENGEKEKQFSIRNMVVDFMYKDKVYFWRIFNGNDIEKMEIKLFAYDLNTKDINLIHEDRENDGEWYYCNGGLLVDTFKGAAKNINLDTMEESSVEFLSDAEVKYCKNDEIVYYKNGVYYLRRNNEDIRLFEGDDGNYVHFIDGDKIIYRDYVDTEVWDNYEYNVYSFDIKTGSREELEMGVKYSVDDFLLAE